MLLAALMLCGGMTAALAAPQIDTDKNVSYSANNALGQIVQNLSDGDSDEKGYAILQPILFIRDKPTPPPRAARLLEMITSFSCAAQV